MRRTLFVMLALVALVGSACGGNDNPTVPTSPAGNSPGGTVTTTTPGGSPAANCTDQTGAAQASFELKDFEFAPTCVIAKHSQGLHLENTGTAEHTFTIDNTTVDFDLQPGAKQDFPGPSPLAPGTYTFYCRFHGSPSGSGMAGTVTVQA